MTMQYSMKSLKGLARRVDVTVPADRFQRQIDSMLQKWSKEWPKREMIPGFRPGKPIPISVVRRRLGEDVIKEAAYDLVNESFAEIMRKEQCKPTERPNLIFESDVEGQPLKFSAEFEIFPDVKLVDFAKLKVKKPVVEISEEDIDNAIEQIRFREAEWTSVDRGSKDQDRITIDFYGTMKGEPFEGSEGKDVQMILGVGERLPDFEKGMKGCKAGDKTKFTVKYPKDYGAPSLDGQKAEFEVTLHRVEEPTLPELNDAFAEKMLATEKTLESLRKDVRSYLERELERQRRTLIHTRLEEELRRTHKVDLPVTLINYEIHRIGHELEMDHDEIQQIKPGDKDPIVRQAEDNVKMGCVITEISNVLEVKVTQDELRDYILSLGFGYPDEEAFFHWYVQDRDRIKQANLYAMRRKLFDVLLEKVKVTEEKMSFEELKSAVGPGG